MQNGHLWTADTYRPSLFLWLMALLAILLLVQLGATPIYILDEAKNAQCAREMLLRGDWIVPTFNGELRTDKPPLHYFFMMLSYRIFGFTAFAARFFSAIAGLSTVLVTYRYTKRHISAFVAFCTALVLVMSAHFLFEFRLSVPDPYLIFFVTLGLFSAYTWLQENKKGQLYIAAIAFSLATLAKGPIALALPGFCLLAWIVIRKKWKVLFTWHLVPALLLLCVITLPWYIAVYKATGGEWVKGFFIDHNLNRFSDPQEGHGGFFLLTPVSVLLGLLPFMSFAGETIRQRKLIFNHPLVQFSGIVFIAFVIFFSISSTKLPNYPMPCYAFAAVILGYFLSSLLDGKFTSGKYPIYIVLSVLLVIPLAGYFAIGQEAEAAAVKWIALLLLAAPVLFIVLLLFSPNRSWPAHILVLCIAYTLFNMAGLHYVYPTLYKQNPVRKTLSLVKDAPAVFSYQIFNAGYNFYLSGNIKRFNQLDSLASALQANPGAVIISRKEYLDALLSLPVTLVSEHHDLFELPTTIILKSNAKP